MRALICTDCGASSETARFYDRITKRCAECHKQRVRQNRKANIAYYRAFEAMRYARDYEKRRAANQAYVQTERGKEAVARSRQAYVARYPERRAAHIALGNALRDGRVVRPAACQACGAGGRIHGHHDDYAKPLEVRWLCSPCHTEAHHGERAIVAQRRQPETRA